MADKKKIIIIGSGLGGLASGIILAKRGYKVTILEQNWQPGGCMQCFTRHGAKFETGMHFIGSCEEGQTLHRLLSDLEVLGANATLPVKLSQLDKNCSDVISLAGKHYQFASGRERWISTLAAQFPSQKANLEKLWNVIEEVSAASSMHSLSNTETDAAVNMEYQLRSINDVVDSYIDDPVLKNVVVGNLPLFAAEKDKTPFSTYAFVMDFYNQSSFRIVGGSDEMVKSMLATLHKYGVEVLCRKKVTHIECDDARAVACVCADGSRYEADSYIADIHPQLLLKLCDSSMLRAAYRNRVASIPNTVGTFSLYLHFNENSVPYMNHNFFSYANSTPWNCENYSSESWPEGYLYMHLCDEENQQFARSGIVMSYMRYEDVKQWEGTRVGHRGADYEAFKHRKAEQLLDTMERDMPGFRKGIKEYFTSTPLTYIDYTGTAEGSMYGLAKNITLGSAGRVHHRTKVPNLFITGQNINSHGILGVLVGALVTTNEFY